MFEKKKHGVVFWSLSYWPDIPSKVVTGARSFPRNERVTQLLNSADTEVPWKMMSPGCGVAALNVARRDESSWSIDSANLSKGAFHPAARLLLIFELAAFSRAARCHVVIHILDVSRRLLILIPKVWDVRGAANWNSFLNVRWLYRC